MTDNFELYIDLLGPLSEEELFGEDNEEMEKVNDDIQQE
jgi:hypothetical protein